MEAGNLMEARRRCTAKSKQSGERCKRQPIPGGTVCVIHGGGSPNAIRSARERLDALVDPAIEGLRKAMDEGEVKDIVKAAQIVLDRTGYGPKSTTELTGKDGGPIETRQTVDTSKLSTETLRRIQKEAGDG